MSVPELTVSTGDVSRSRDLFVLYAKKGAFELSEYCDVGSVFKNLSAALESAADAKEVSLGAKDVAYVLSAINVCSQRTPVEVQNYKTIANLFETFGEALKGVSGVEEESKTD